MSSPIEKIDTALERVDEKAKDAHRYNDEWLVATIPHLRVLLLRARRSLEQGNISPESITVMSIAEQIIASTEK